LPATKVRLQTRHRGKVSSGLC